MHPALEAGFATIRPDDDRRRLCIWHVPRAIAVQGLVVHVHAFAEEMNKSRRMVALQARALAAAGYAVLQLDLLGCGDSEGDSGDATWEIWVADVVAACGLALERWPGAKPPTRWLWGNRAGCLLAAEAASRLDTSWNLLFWQAATSGKVILQQFLRLESAGALLGKTAGKGPTSAKARLAGGRQAQVAGYTIAPGLAQGMEAARLAAPRSGCRVEWLDVAANADLPPSPAAAEAVRAWIEGGCAVRHQRVAGPSFWQTTEIEDAPDLIVATLRALAEPAPVPVVQPAGASLDP